MFRFTSTKTGLCMDRVSDCAERFSEFLTSLDLGSPDPMSEQFDSMAYLAAECLTKHPSLGSAESPARRESLAIEKLFVSDDRMRLINEKGFDHKNFSYDASCGLLQTARSLIGNLLVGYDRHFLDDSVFSNGASQGFKLQDAAPFKKIAGQATVTVACYNLAVRTVKTVPLWHNYMCERYGDESLWFKRTYGNGLFTVPKNNKIDRAACKEPDMNMYLQKGVGSFIRNRLRSVGIDLNDQSRNQRLAKLGSLDGSLATIDLSSASDSISDRLVWELLPPDLYSYLDLIRSKATIVDSRYHRWSLFSTMGNGFTFELESLIFWALVRSVQILSSTPGPLGIYGDDIIVPSSMCAQVLNALECYGFLPNKKKTFISGFFRESCGAHYFKGIDVKPFYIKQPVDSLPRMILLLNRIRGWGTSCGMADPRLYPFWKQYSQSIPDILKGACNLDSDLALVTGDYPRQRLYRKTKDQSGFGPVDYFVSHYHNGRYIQWLHRPGTEVSQTISSNRFGLCRNSEWDQSVPTFPQEELDH